MILKALKPKETDFEPQTLGQHLKKKRRELGWTLEEVGDRLGVTMFSVINWEADLRKPLVQYRPAIRDFLGYDPQPDERKSFSEQLAAKRTELGWSQKHAARNLGVDTSTWSTWENGGTVMRKTHRQLLAQFVGVKEDELYRVMRARWNSSHKRRTTE